MVRSAEFFGLKTIYIYDKNELLAIPKNKKQKADMAHLAKVWTAGAVDHIDIQLVHDIPVFFKSYQGRKIATVIDQRATNLHHFKFQENDLLIMGPEKNGLSHSSRVLCDEKIYLPNRGETDCLNVSVMLGILLYSVQSQLQ